MLRLLDAPGTRRDVYHYVVADGFDPPRGLFRFQFGDGKARWAKLERLEKLEGRRPRVAPGLAPDRDRGVRRAVVLESPGRVDEADARYRQVLVVRPGSVRAWVDLGNAEADRGRRRPEKGYRRALEIAPDDRDALNNLAWLLLEEGARLEEAEALAARAASQPGPTAARPGHARSDPARARALRGGGPHV